ncbi:class I SAM-dependent methyltransferase [Chloroflexota bacterium]
MYIVWIVLISVSIFLILTALLFGVRRINVPRRVIPEEGIEDIEVVLAYDRISKWPQFRLLRMMITNELKKYKPQGILADVGCGPGYLIADMAKSFPSLSIIGVDISEEMEHKAKKNFERAGLGEKVNFRRGDIQELPFDNNTLDFVVSTLSLHHWSEPKQAIQEINRVLKPQGQFLVFDLRRDSWRLIYWILRFAQLIILPSPMRYMNEPTNSFLSSYSPAELDTLMSISRLDEWKVKPGFFWTFIWGSKS